MHQRLKMLTTVAMAGASTDGVLLCSWHRSEVLMGTDPLKPHKPPRGHPCPGHLTEGEREAPMPEPGRPEGTALPTPCQESNKLHMTKAPPAAPANAFLGQHCTRRVSKKLPGGMWFRQAKKRSISQWGSSANTSTMRPVFSTLLGRI